MQVGDFLKDNDPRMPYRAKMKIIEVHADYVRATCHNRAFVLRAQANCIAKAEAIELAIADYKTAT